MNAANTDHLKHRIFIGLPVPCHVAQSIKAQIQDPEATSRPVHPADLHVTLYFLGNQPDAVVSALDQVLKGPLLQQAPVQVELTRTIAFPSLQRPRLIAAEVVQTPALNLLHHDMGQLLITLLDRWPTLKPETRPWRPHVTLCWLKRQAKAGDLPIDRPLNLSWYATEVMLFESRPGQSPRYHTLARWQLGGTFASD